MPLPAIQGNLAGTTEDQFTLGSEGEDVGIFRDSSGRLAFKDHQVVGVPTLSQLLESVPDLPRDYIAADVTVNVPLHRQYITYNRVVLDGTMECDGLGVTL